MRALGPVLPLLLLCAAGARASDPPPAPSPSLWERWLAADKMEWLANSAHLALLSTSVQNPIVRPASGGGELELPQSARTWSPRLSGLWAWENLGFEAGVSYLKVDLQPFVASDFAVPAPGAAPTHYSSPSWRLITVDLMVHWVPLRWLPIDLYGLLGLSDRAYAYTAAGASFEQWNGLKENNEFTYGYGFGVRLMPVRWVSLLAEIRWMPGDSITPLTDCTPIPDEPGWETCRLGSSSTASYTRLLSVGVAINFP